MTNKAAGASVAPRIADATTARRRVKVILAVAIPIPRHAAIPLYRRDVSRHAGDRLAAGRARDSLSGLFPALARALRPLSRSVPRWCDLGARGIGGRGQCRVAADPCVAAALCAAPDGGHD